MIPPKVFANPTTDKLIAMKKFHNYVKGELYAKYTKNKEWILEFGGGRYNDIFRWIQNRIKNVVVTDLDEEALKIGENRKEDIIASGKQVPNIISFVANMNDKTFKHKVDEHVGKNVKFDVINCHFAIHYIFSAPESVQLLIDNVKLLLKDGGYFVVTTFNGQKVVDLLNKNNISEFESLTLKKKIKGEDENVFTIQRLYSNNELNDIGQKINVYVESLGGHYDEYLVNFNYFQDIMKDNRFDIIEHVAFTTLKKKWNNKKFIMSPAEKIFSDLSDYIVFKKK